MEISGTYTFNAPRDRVWAILMNPDAIAGCIPGCDRFEPDGENRYRARLTVAMAAITGSYEGTVALVDLKAPESYRLEASGHGRPGFLNGSSTVTLREEGLTTVVDVKGTVQTGGTIARLGQRIMGGVSQMMMDRFFACLQSKIS